VCENLEAMRPERGNIYVNNSEKMDSAHKQGLRKECCAQKIDLERKKQGKKNSRLVLLDLERTKERIKTIYCANHFWKKSKSQGEKKNEQPLLCFSSLPSSTRGIRQCEKLGSFEKGKLKAEFAFQ